ncbi:MAG TPA: GNAT family N-acetyltransferase [Gemmataceae bacterium]|nr:GNAT family N-acetyltransferase [Gemmataceae bacterium]
MDPDSHVATARPEDRESALRLVFLHFKPGERDKRVANALHLMEAGNLDPDGLFVAREGERVSGAMICLPIPGASALVWPPRTRPMARAASVEDALVGRAASWLRQRGAKLGQALLAPDEVQFAKPLERNGFRNVTTLCYLRRSADQPLERSGRSHLDWRPYESRDRALFAQTLLRTYEGTRDCPEVNGIRTIDEILDGHAADAGRNYEHWCLAYEGPRPVGVLLMTESAEWQAWELAYVGVVPEARGRGIGRELVCRALAEARAAETTQLTLCVDSRNAPALTLYRSLRFERYDERAVFLAVWCEIGAGNRPRTN